MKKVLKYTGISLLSIVVLILLAYCYISSVIDSAADTVYSFPPHQIAITQDDATRQAGKHLVLIRGCVDCHGADLGGKLMNDDFAIGTLTASNLTKGRGGLPGDYNTQNWLNALRHGISKEGKPLLFMPAHESAPMSDNDIAAIISYVESIPDVDRVLPEIETGPLAKVLGYFKKIPLFSVDLIDHNAAPLIVADVEEGIGQGKYLSVSCQSCHRVNMRGGEPLVPGQPPVPDITSAGTSGKWTQEAFIKTLRTGTTPSGKQMRNEDMPWKMTSNYTDQELRSLYQYLKSI